MIDMMFVRIVGGSIRTNDKTFKTGSRNTKIKNVT